MRRRPERRILTAHQSYLVGEALVLLQKAEVRRERCPATCTDPGADFYRWQAHRCLDRAGQSHLLRRRRPR